MQRRWSRGSGTGRRFTTRKSSRSLSNHGGVSMIRLRTWNVTARVDRTGHFAREREAIVLFEFARIKSLQFNGEDAETQDHVHGDGIERIEQGLSFRVRAIVWTRWRTDGGSRLLFMSTRNVEAHPFPLADCGATDIGFGLVDDLRTRDSCQSRAESFVVRGQSTRARTCRSGGIHRASFGSRPERWCCRTADTTHARCRRVWPTARRAWEWDARVYVKLNCFAM